MLWKQVRSSWWGFSYHAKDWFERLRYWYAPSKRAEKLRDIAETKAHYRVT
jgi:hypothetical protein